MTTERKRQLIISTVLLAMILTTLLAGYKNFKFHTFISVLDYQYCLTGSNDDFQIENYQIYKKDSKAYNGGARLYGLQEGFFKKDDVLKTSFHLKTETNDYEVTFENKVSIDNQVVYLGQKENSDLGDFIYESGTMDLQVIRDDQVIYNDNVELSKQQLFSYNGSNKIYSIHDVYTTNDWIKSGSLMINDEDVMKQYGEVTIDYLLLKSPTLDSTDVENYDRILHINGSLEDMLEGKLGDNVFLETGIGNKQLSVVVTLKDKESGETYTFMLPLVQSGSQE